ncbi:hypothetical protein HDU97_003162 [Phlyctochytrium planicorne]|nr:hypothetical protein HDU97_003162 [Phlyctochytrium planicorne]
MSDTQQPQQAGAGDLTVITINLPASTSIPLNSIPSSLITINTVTKPSGFTGTNKVIITVPTQQSSAASSNVVPSSTGAGAATTDPFQGTIHGFPIWAVGLIAAIIGLALLVCLVTILIFRTGRRREKNAQVFNGPMVVTADRRQTFVSQGTMTSDGGTSSSGESLAATMGSGDRGDNSRTSRVGIGGAMARIGARLSPFQRPIARLPNRRARQPLPPVPDHQRAQHPPPPPSTAAATAAESARFSAITASSQTFSSSGLSTSSSHPYASSASNSNLASHAPSSPTSGSSMFGFKGFGRGSRYSTDSYGRRNGPLARLHGRLPPRVTKPPRGGSSNTGAQNESDSELEIGEDVSMGHEVSRGANSSSLGRSSVVSVLSGSDGGDGGGVELEMWRRQQGGAAELRYEGAGFQHQSPPRIDASRTHRPPTNPPPTSPEFLKPRDIDTVVDISAPSVVSPEFQKPRDIDVIVDIGKKSPLTTALPNTSTSLNPPNNLGSNNLGSDDGFLVARSAETPSQTRISPMPSSPSLNPQSHLKLPSPTAPPPQPPPRTSFKRVSGVSTTTAATTTTVTSTSGYETSSVATSSLSRGAESSVATSRGDQRPIHNRLSAISSEPPSSPATVASSLYESSVGMSSVSRGGGRGDSVSEISESAIKEFEKNRQVNYMVDPALVAATFMGGAEDSFEVKTRVDEEKAWMSPRPKPSKLVPAAGEAVLPLMPESPAIDISEIPPNFSLNMDPKEMMVILMSIDRPVAPPVPDPPLETTVEPDQEPEPKNPLPAISPSPSVNTISSLTRRLSQHVHSTYSLRKKRARLSAEDGTSKKRNVQEDGSEWPDSSPDLRSRASVSPGSMSVRTMEDEEAGRSPRLMTRNTESPGLMTRNAYSPRLMTRNAESPSFITRNSESPSNAARNSDSPGTVVHGSLSLGRDTKRSSLPASTVGGKTIVATDLQEPDFDSNSGHDDKDKLSIQVQDGTESLARESSLQIESYAPPSEQEQGQEPPLSPNSSRKKKGWFGSWGRRPGSQDPSPASATKPEMTSPVATSTGQNEAESTTIPSIPRLFRFRSGSGGEKGDLVSPNPTTSDAGNLGMVGGNGNANGKPGSALGYLGNLGRVFGFAGGAAGGQAQGQSEPNSAGTEGSPPRTQESQKAENQPRTLQYPAQTEESLPRPSHSPARNSSAHTSEISEIVSDRKDGLPAVRPAWNTRNSSFFDTPLSAGQSDDQDQFDVAPPSPIISFEPSTSNATTVPLAESKMEVKRVDTVYRDIEGVEGQMLFRHHTGVTELQPEEYQKSKLVKLENDEAPPPRQMSAEDVAALEQESNVIIMEALEEVMGSPVPQTSKPVDGSDKWSRGPPGRPKSPRRLEKVEKLESDVSSLTSPESVVSSVLAYKIKGQRDEPFLMTKEAASNANVIASTQQTVSQNTTIKPAGTRDEIPAQIQPTPPPRQASQPVPPVRQSSSVLQAVAAIAAAGTSGPHSAPVSNYATPNLSPSVSPLSTPNQKRSSRVMSMVANWESGVASPPQPEKERSKKVNPTEEIEKARAGMPSVAELRLSVESLESLEEKNGISGGGDSKPEVVNVAQGTVLERAKVFQTTPGEEPPEKSPERKAEVKRLEIKETTPKDAHMSPLKSRAVEEAKEAAGKRAAGIVEVKEGQGARDATIGSSWGTARFEGIPPKARASTAWQSPNATPTSTSMDPNVILGISSPQMDIGPPPQRLSVGSRGIIRGDVKEMDVDIDDTSSEISISSASSVTSPLAGRKLRPVTMPEGSLESLRMGWERRSVGSAITAGAAGSRIITMPMATATEEGAASSAPGSQRTSFVRERKSFSAVTANASEGNLKQSAKSATTAAPSTSWDTENFISAPSSEQPSPEISRNHVRRRSAPKVASVVASLEQKRNSREDLLLDSDQTGEGGSSSGQQTAHRRRLKPRPKSMDGGALSASQSLNPSPLSSRAPSLQSMDPEDSRSGALAVPGTAGAGSGGGGTNAVARKAFQPGWRKEEIPLNVGDLVRVVERFDDGWCKGVNMTQGRRVGIFPFDCVDVVQSRVGMMATNQGGGGISATSAGTSVASALTGTSRFSGGNWKDAFMEAFGGNNGMLAGVKTTVAATPSSVGHTRNASTVGTESVVGGGGSSRPSLEEVADDGNNGSIPGSPAMHRVSRGRRKKSESKDFL